MEYQHEVDDDQYEDQRHQQQRYEDQYDEEESGGEDYDYQDDELEMEEEAGEGYDDQYGELLDIFWTFADEQTEQLNHRQLLKTLHSAGYFVDLEQVKKWAQQCDDDGNGTTSWEELLQIIECLEKEKMKVMQEQTSSPQYQQQQVHYMNEAQAAKPGQKPTDISRALFIGINYPGTDAPLKGCVNDVRTMHNIIKHLNHTILQEKVFVDDAKYPGRTGAPTKKNIVAGLKWLVQGAKSGDKLFLHYSGHGTQVEDEAGGDEADGMDEALCPADYEENGLVVDDDIYKWVVKGLPTGVRLTAVFDCCHSGSIMDLPFTFTADARSINAARESGALKMECAGRAAKSEKSKHNGTIFMISGCRDDQTSADVQSGPQAGGACTNAIAELVSGKGGKRDRNLIELLDAMRNNLAREEFTQVPQLSSSVPISNAARYTFLGTMPNAV